MNNICIFTVPASRDIERIIDYVSDNSNFDVAESLLKKINAKCNNLANFPNKYLGKINCVLVIASVTK